MARVSLLFAVAASIAHRGSAGSIRAAKNPIRNVVTMLQKMQGQVQAEGEKEKELYEKFMCYCKSGNGDLSSTISSAEERVPAVGSDIEASESKLTQTKEDLKQAQSDRSAAKDAMAEATALREKEATAFAAEKAEADTNIAAIAKAVAALEKGMTGAFLQTSSADALRQLAQGGDQSLLDEVERQELLSFLSGSQTSGYAPQSGDITGILKQLGDTMAKSLADSTASEEAAIKSYGEVMAAKTKEVSALTSSVETKTQQIGELGVAIVQMKEDLSDTEAALAADREFLQELTKSCSTKTAEFDERSKTRADELVAIADTIKVLNDDDALELFKKTMPSASVSFAQVSVTSSSLRARALDAIKGARQAALRQDKASLDLLALTLAGKRALNQGGFDKVIKMCDDMVVILKKEQTDDEHKKEYCGTQFDMADDKRKALERTVSQEENEIATAKDAITTLAEEITALEHGIKAMDKSVTEATENRKEENAEYKELMASNGAAKEVIGWAKNRLNKFYNPKLYVAPAKQELSREERIFVNNGGTPPPTAAPAGIAGTGISAAAFLQVRAAPAPPPATWDAYSKKSEGSNGVIAMMDLLMRDLEKEMTEAEAEEKSAQGDYETMMRESSSKRTADTASLSEKNAAKADMQSELVEHNEAKTAAASEMMATHKYISSLHAECDWLIQYFDVRKEARTAEIDSLQKAKAVLSGADYSLVQTRSHGFLARSS